MQLSYYVLDIFCFSNLEVKLKVVTNYFVYLKNLEVEGLRFLVCYLHILKKNNVRTSSIFFRVDFKNVTYIDERCVTVEFF